MKKEISAHDFKSIYPAFGIDLSDLGCVMLDLITPFDLDKYGKSLNDNYLYKAKDKNKFWIDGFVALDTPHITLLYGLLKSAHDYSEAIETVLSGWELYTATVDRVGYFESPYPDEPYYCIVAHMALTPDLMEGHNRLEMLPHINTFPGYKAHFTVCYVKKDKKIRDAVIKDLNTILKGRGLAIANTKHPKGLNFGIKK